MTKNYTLADGTIFKVSTRKNKVTKDLLGDWHQSYYIIINIRGVERKFTFHDSVYNYRLGRVSPSLIEDAIGCIVSDCYAAKNNPLFWEFANEFGYGDEEMATARRAFNGCHNSLRKMEELFSWAEIEELSEKF